MFIISQQTCMPDTYFSSVFLQAVAKVVQRLNISLFFYIFRLPFVLYVKTIC